MKQLALRTTMSERIAEIKRERDALYAERLGRLQAAIDERLVDHLAHRVDHALDAILAGG